VDGILDSHEVQAPIIAGLKKQNVLLLRSPCMHISILHNADCDLLEDDPGREAREDVRRVVRSVTEALRGEGFGVDAVPVVGDSFAFLDALKERPPDLVLNLCESLAADSRGEMVIPCLLELLHLPYTGSSGLALALALHKPRARDLLKARGVPAPQGVVIQERAQLKSLTLPFPLIVKPVREDASVGIEFDSVVEDATALEKAVSRILSTLSQPALVEQYIPGREISVSLLGNSPRGALPLTEIRFGKAFEGRPNILSYGAKWDVKSAEYIDSPSGPCELPSELQARCIQVALDAFEALECRDYGRVDLRLTPAGEPYVIDINPNCDLSPDAGFAKAAASAGWTYPALARKLVEVALERNHGDSTHRRVRSRTPRRVAPANRNVLGGRSRLRARAH
jgi:D-alanine-D-alanine ligase